MSVQTHNRLTIPGVSEMLPPQHFSSLSINTVIPSASHNRLSALPDSLLRFLYGLSATLKVALLVTIFLSLLSAPVFTSIAAYTMVSQSNAIAVIRTQNVPSSGVIITLPGDGTYSTDEIKPAGK